MVNRLLLWAAGSSRLEHAVANNRLLGKTVHRFVAGAQLSDAVSAAVDLNTRGIGAILDLLGEGVEDLAGASEAAGQYLEAVEVIAERGIDSTVSLKLSRLGLTVNGRPAPRTWPGSWSGRTSSGSVSKSTWSRATWSAGRWTCSGRPSAAFRRPAWPFRRAADILAFMSALDTREIHGYLPEFGYRVFTDTALHSGPSATQTPHEWHRSQN